MTTEFDWDVFVSYATDDIALVDEVARTLRGQGARVFVDRDCIPDSVRTDEIAIREYLAGALGGSSALVVLWGQGHAGSSWCRWEWERFRESGRPIFVMAVDHFEPDAAWLEGTIALERDDLSSWRDGEFVLGHQQNPRPAPASEAGLSTLLLRPAEWARRIRILGPSYSLLELLTERRAWKAPAFRKMSASIVLGSWGTSLLVLLGLVLVAGRHPGDADWLRRQLLLSGGVGLVGGGLLILGHGVGAGAVATLASTVVGSTTTFLVFWLGLTRQGYPAAVSAGVLLAVCATYRHRLGPLYGVDLARPLRAMWTSYALMSFGVLAAGSLLACTLIFNNELARAAVDLGFEATLASVPWRFRALFGGGLGLLTGLSAAIASAQRLSFRVRPRESRQRGVAALVVFVAFVTVFGATLASMDGLENGRPREGAVLGVLSAFVACTIYLLPGVGAGLRLSEAAKSRWSLVGAALLATLGWALINGKLLPDVAGVVIAAKSPELAQLPLLKQAAAIAFLNAQLESLKSQIDQILLLFLVSLGGTYAIGSASGWLSRKKATAMRRHADPKREPQLTP